jgi:hypothetical protein
MRNRRISNPPLSEHYGAARKERRTMKFRAEREKERDLSAKVRENWHGYQRSFFAQRKAHTSVFCGSVFDTLRFFLVVGKGCSSEWRWVMGMPRVSLRAIGFALPQSFRRGTDL